MAFSPPTKPIPKTTVPLSPNSPVDRGAGTKPADSWGMATDIGDLWVYVEGNKVENIRERVIQDGAKIKLTIDGAHTVTISVDDHDREILRGRNIIRHKSQIFLQSRWWTLVQGSKNGDQLDLTFEDAHTANLRTYGKLLLLPKTWGSRCQFVWRLVLEAAATDKSLNYESPCAGKNIPQKLINSVLGLQTPSSPYIRDPYTSVKPSTKKPIYVDGVPANAAQIDIINTIMDVCSSMNVRRKVAVTVVMIGIHESTLRNLQFDQSPVSVLTGHPHRGVWQQDPFYWPASGNVRTDAIGDGTKQGVVTACNKVDKQYPNISVNDLANRTQVVSGYDFFGQGGEFRIEAERIVTAWGWSGGDITTTLPKSQQPKTGSAITAGAGEQPFGKVPDVPPAFMTSGGSGGINNQWHRGAPVSKKGVRRYENEDSWKCIQRMASEVNWYAFMLGDYLVFAPGDWLFAKKVDYTFKEFEQGVSYIDFDYDVNKKNATCTIHSRIEEWPVDPGNVITLEDMGIVDGNWMVSAYERSLFSHEVTVTCIKPKPKFPEPTATSNVFQPGTTTGGEIVPPSKSPIVGEDIRHSIAAWAVSGTKGPPPYYRSPSDPINKKAGFWPERMDCSGFVIQCYCWGSKVNEKYDPCQNGWGGGSTGTMYPHGRTIPQGQAQMADVVIWSNGPAVGGDREHTAVFIEDWHGDATAMVSHGGSTPGPHQTTFGDETSWQLINHSARPTVKNYID